MELLDDVKEELKKKPIFSLISISMFCLFLMLLYHVGTNGLENNGLAKTIASIVLLIIGCLGAGIGFVRREMPKVIRYVALILHIFVVLTIAAAVIFDF